MRKVLYLGLVVGLAGCQSFTPQQTAAFCALAQDGTVLALASTKGGAQQTAQKIAAVQQVVPCDATATAVGIILSSQK